MLPTLEAMEVCRDAICSSSSSHATRTLVAALYSASRFEEAEAWTARIESSVMDELERAQTLARIDLARGNVNAARAHLRTAQRSVNDDTPAWVRGVLTLDLARADVLDGRLPVARARLEEAVEDISTAGPQLAAGGRMDLAMVLARLGDTESARHHLLRSRTLMGAEPAPATHFVVAEATVLLAEGCEQMAIQRLREGRSLLARYLDPWTAHCADAIAALAGPELACAAAEASVTLRAHGEKRRMRTA